MILMFPFMINEPFFVMSGISAICMYLLLHISFPLCVTDTAINKEVEYVLPFAIHSCDGNLGLWYFILWLCNLTLNSPFFITFMSDNVSFVK